MKRLGLCVVCAFGVASVATMGCDKPRAAGGSCGLAEEGKLVACESPTAALRCGNIRLRAVPCRGPRGCIAGTPAFCDQSIAEPGDPCAEAGHTAQRETACSVDRTKTLICEKGSFVAARPCRGPKGCTPDSYEASCDQTIGEPGDPCSGHGAVGSCSVDRKSLLECADDPAIPTGAGPPWRRKKLVVEGDCPTTKGCEIAHLTGTDIPTAVCDYRGLGAGDRCSQAHANREICSPDGAILRCDATSHTFVPSRPCPSGQRCVPSGGLEKQINPVVTCQAAPTK